MEAEETTNQPGRSSSGAPDGEALARVVRFAAALIDPDRLRIAGMLAEAPSSRYEVIERTGLSESEVQKHLQRLQDGGIVRRTASSLSGPDAARRSSMYDRFEVDRAALHALGPEIGKLQGRGGPRPTEDRERVIAAFFDDDGRLMSFPRKAAHLVWLLECIVERFEHGREYPEREVNALLKTIHDDHASLRRYLVDYGLMSRANGIYRREWSPAAEKAAAPAEA